MKRCPDCGAANPERAQWCGQCYRAFVPDQPEPGATPTQPPPARPAGDSTGGDSNAAGLTAGDSIAGDSSGGDSIAGGSAAKDWTSGEFPGAVEPAAGAHMAAFWVHEGQVRWRCPVCGVDNDVAVRACTGCGTALADRPAPARPSVPVGRALAAALLAPGGGHLLLGRTGEGIARIAVALVWCGGAAALLAAGGPARAAPAAAPLLLGTMLLWAGGVADVLALREGGRPLLSGRALLWLVVIVTGLAGFGLVGAVLRIRAGAGGA